jgi:hypothetical protein
VTDRPEEAMPDRSDLDRIVDANRYLVLSTADAAGTPWATPVFFAPLGADRFCWVSSPDSRHSRNIAARPTVAAAVFDSTVAVGRAEAAYLEADAARAAGGEEGAVLRALNDRLPAGKRLDADDLQPAGPLVAYAAVVRRRAVLVRGGDPVLGNPVDTTVEV